MAKKRMSRAGIAVRVVIVVALAVAIYYLWQWRTSGPVAQLEKVRIASETYEGDGRQRVIELMGPPDGEAAAFPLPEEEALARDAEKVTAKTWLLWNSWLGTRCVVGLDHGNRVVYKGHTGT
jgi:hypothetical protein